MLRVQLYKMTDQRVGKQSVANIRSLYYSLMIDRLANVVSVSWTVLHKLASLLFWAQINLSMLGQ